MAWWVVDVSGMEMVLYGLIPRWHYVGCYVRCFSSPFSCMPKKNKLSILTTSNTSVNGCPRSD